MSNDLKMSSNRTKADTLGNLFHFFRNPNAWTPRSINAMIDDCVTNSVSFWDLAFEKLGEFGIRDLTRIMGVQ